jgi:hypothetical protein
MDFKLFQPTGLSSMNCHCKGCFRRQRKIDRLKEEYERLIAENARLQEAAIPEDGSCSMSARQHFESTKD